MTVATMAAVLASGVELLERAMSYTLGSLSLATPAAMSNPTPCRHWDLRALLLHMNDSVLALHEAVAAGHVGLDPAAGCPDPAGRFADPATDPVLTLRNRGCQMIGAWAGARGHDEISIADRALTPGIVAATGAVEIAVHGWDVGRACGRDRPLPPALAGTLLELCPLLVTAADRPVRFAAPVDVSPMASPSDRLVAFLGRRPR
jgi:uncharacterized protein (TIGR03086 family)